MKPEMEIPGAIKWQDEIQKIIRVKREHGWIRQHWLSERGVRIPIWNHSLLHLMDEDLLGRIVVIKIIAIYINREGTLQNG